jgi:glycosyltransferase involved in cell wall biosynthesis
MIREKIELIRAIDPGEQGMYAYILSKLTGVPWCVSVHADRDLYHDMAGTFLLFGSRKISRAVEKFVLGRAPLVLAISRYIADWVISMGTDPDRVRIIYHGIDVSGAEGPEASPGAGFKVPEGKKVVSFVGRLSREKYVHDVVLIAAELSKKRKDTVFLIVGEGQEKEDLEKMISENGLAGTVILLGARPNAEVNRIRKISDVNFCPLSGFSLLEAALSGKPVVAYDVEWHKELVENGKTGMLVPKGDTAAAAAAIDKLLSDPVMGAELGKNARYTVKGRHSMEKVSLAKLDCYRELAGIYSRRF